MNPKTGIIWCVAILLAFAAPVVYAIDTSIQPQINDLEKALDEAEKADQAAKDPKNQSAGDAKTAADKEDAAQQKWEDIKNDPNAKAKDKEQAQKDAENASKDANKSAQSAKNGQTYRDKLKKRREKRRLLKVAIKNLQDAINKAKTDGKNIVKDQESEANKLIERANGTLNKLGPLAMAFPPGGPEAATNTLVGIVTPADARPGDQISGRVVTDPKRYENVPGLKVFETQAPLQQVGGQATLTGLVVDTPEEEPQSAEDRIRFRIPEEATQIVFTLLRTDNPSFRVPGSSPLTSPEVPSRGEPTPVSRGESLGGGSGCCTHLGQPVNCPSGLPAGSESLKFVQGGAIWRTPDGKEVTAPVSGLTPCNQTPGSNTYEAPPIIQSGTVQVVRGAFDGDSSKTAVKIGDKSCNVVAESPRSAYVDVPPDIPKGATEMTVEENGRGAKIPVCGLTVGVSADKLTLKTGEKTTAHYVISGPEDLPASSWRAGVSKELINLEQLAALDRNAQFPRKGEEGKLLLTIVSSGSIKMKGGQNNRIVKWLERKDFEGGPYKDDVDLQATAPGGFGLTVTAYSFLAPVKGEPFDVQNDSGSELRQDESRENSRPVSRGEPPTPSTSEKKPDEKPIPAKGTVEQPCAGAELRVRHAYSECNKKDGLWHVVEDAYYACPPAGKIQKFRVSDMATEFRCDAQQAPPKLAGGVYKLLAGDTTCQSPVLDGQLTVPVCTNDQWVYMTYDVYKCVDGGSRIAEPAKSTEQTGTPCTKTPPPPTVK